MPSRVLLQTCELTFGEFTCPPGDPLGDEINTNIGPQPHVVFPRTRVLIAQDGARPVLATPNHVIFSRAHQLYRRGLRDARGREELPAGPRDPPGRGDVPARRWPAPYAPSRRSTGPWPRRRRCGCSTRRSRRPSRPSTAAALEPAGSTPSWPRPRRSCWRRGDRAALAAGDRP